MENNGGETGGERVDENEVGENGDGNGLTNGNQQFGKFTPQIEEWRGRDLSGFFGNEKLHFSFWHFFKRP